MSAFRGIFLPGVNLAEAGQAGMKQQQNHQLLSLVDAAYKDIWAWLWQDKLYKAMLDNCTNEKSNKVCILIVNLKCFKGQ